MIMDKIISELSKELTHKIGNTYFHTICYADHVIDGRNQKKQTCRKCMRFSKDTIRCKVRVDGKILEQNKEFKYLGVKLTYGGRLRGINARLRCS